MIEQMTFTTDWVTKRDDWWRELCAPMIGRPTQMLEIGFYEGRSAQWWLLNLLTNPSSRLTCVERWGSKSTANRELIAADPTHGHKLTFAHENAVTWAANSIGTGVGECFDMVYIDFSKEAADVMTMACLAWLMLKPGGLLLFDDYTWRWETVVMESRRPNLEPYVGIDAWLTAHAPFVGRTEQRTGQLAVWKKQISIGA